MPTETKVETMEESTPRVDLKALIHHHATFFDKLVELIPAKFYLPTADDDDDKPWFQGLTKSQKALSKKQTKANVKRARRDRLDPEKSSATTLDLLRQKLEKEKQNVDDEETEAEAVLSGFDEEEEEEGGGGSNQRSKTYEDLRHRLHLKIEACRSQRNTGCSKREQKRLGRRDGRPPPPLQPQAQPKRKRVEPDPAEALNALEFGKVKLDGGGDKNNNKKWKLSKSQELKRAEEMRERGGGGVAAAAERAVIRAAGGKVHDDPGVLRKSIRKEKRKSQKSAQQWKDRVQNQNRAMADKQRKRTVNINKKKDEKKQRKIDKREKKLLRPGFEGRKNPASA